MKLSSLINPDPTLDLFYRVLSAEPGVVLVAPPAGLSLSEGVAALTGGIGRQSMVTADHLLLEVQGAEGVRGILAAFDPARVIVGSLEGANALELRFAADGQSLEIFGAQVESLPTQGFISSMLLILTLAGTAAWMLYGSRARLLPSLRVQILLTGYTTDKAR
ncbi:MAG TPA: hypothetical protein EYQ60_14750 [Myxococcales bacterium]|nr:hypothetical protein [Myxococcales bacterium]